MRLSLPELLERLRRADETVEIEAKLAEDLGGSIIETVCALSNEPNRGGGYILLGIRAEDDLFARRYTVNGIREPDRIQQTLATQCSGMLNVPVRPELTVESVNGRNVIVAFIPEAQPHDKPVYLKSRGLHKGCYRRIGPTDQHCTDEDIALLYQLRDHKTFDETVVPSSSFKDVDNSSVREYRRARSDVNPSASELDLDDSGLLHALGAIVNHDGHSRLTIAGMIMFGKESALRRHFPMTRVDYIRVEGREWVENPDTRYQTVELLGPLPLIIPRILKLIIDDLPKAFSLDVLEAHRQELPVVPRMVVREAVVNALMHRSYRNRGPVQIIRYANRLEIRNPGHSLVPDERLGEPGSLPRNEKIAAVLHEVGLAETKGTGIRAMREEMRKANLTAPIFESDRERDSFLAIFLVHHLLGPDDLKWLGKFKDCKLAEDEARALLVLREVGAINNAVYRNINHVDTLWASGRLRRLRDLFLVQQRGRGASTYYVPGERLRQLQPDKNTDKQKSALSAVLPAGFPDLPQNLADEIQAVGGRAAPSVLRPVLLNLCNWMPLRPDELAQILGRNRNYLLEDYLRPMLKNGELEYLYPRNPRHPRQAYRGAGSTSLRPKSAD